MLTSGAAKSLRSFLLATPNRLFRRLIVSTILTVVAVGLTGLTLWADFSPYHWLFFKPITLPQIAESEFLAEVTVDHEVFRESQASLSDLRIIGSIPDSLADSQQEIPYKLVVERGKHQRESIEVAISDQRSVPKQHSSFVIDLSQDGILHNEVELHTKSQNFQRQVIVEGSKNRDGWEILQDHGRIFDLTIKEKDFSTQDTRISYPASTDRYLRIKIVGKEKEALDIYGATAYFTQESAPEEMTYPTTVTLHQEEEKKQRSITVFDLGNQGYPTNRLVVDTPQDNFYRETSLEVSNDAETWQAIHESEALYSYTSATVDANNFSINYPESTLRYFRLIIHNQDNPPLPITGARAQGYAHALIFHANSDKSYRLYYGNKTASAPSYDLERLYPYLDAGYRHQGQMGDQASNSLYKAQPVVFTERYPWLLPVIVAVASIIIGVFLFGLLRRIRMMLPPPDDRDQS